MRCTQFGKSLIVLWKHVITLWKHLFSWYICLHIKQFLFVFFWLIFILLLVKYPGNKYFLWGGVLILNVLYKLIVCDTYFFNIFYEQSTAFLRIKEFSNHLNKQCSNFISCRACCVRVFGFLSLPI